MYKLYQIHTFFMDVSTVVMTVVAVTVGIMLISTLLIPQAEDAIKDLEEDHEDWASLFGVVVVCSIISLVVVALYAFKQKK